MEYLHVRSAKAEDTLFRAVLETAPGFGCDREVAGNPKLPDGWDMDELATLVRGTKSGRAKIPDMLVMLHIVEGRKDADWLSRRRGIHLNRSLKGAGWRRVREESGSPWLPPP